MDARYAFRGQIREENPSEVAVASNALFQLVQSTRLFPTGANGEEHPEEANWRSSFIIRILEILQGFDEERPLLQSKGSGSKIALRDWMNVRVVTISMRPFMVLARANFGLPTNLCGAGFPLDSKALCSADRIFPELNLNDQLLHRIETITQCITGLQNYILGWEKDHTTRNPLNAIEILIDQGLSPVTSVANVISIHNTLVSSIIRLTHAVETALEEPKGDISQPAGGSIYSPDPNSKLFSENLTKYIELLLGFGPGLAMWSANCKRYNSRHG